MPEESKTLEMRVAELEDKLNKLATPTANIPQVCSCSTCLTCFHCIIAQFIIQQCIIQQCIFECTCGPCGGCVVSSPMSSGMAGFSRLGR